MSNVEIEPANDKEIQETINVMGGEDLEMWVDGLLKAEVLEKGADVIAYSYIGPKITYPIYRNGTIGTAKEDLERVSKVINEKLKQIEGSAYISINKALVTQSSSAIPVVPLYISLLDKVLKGKNLNEGSIEQIYRLYSEIADGNTVVDHKGRIRIDDREMREDVQKEIAKLWEKITTENVQQITNINIFREDFFKLFGFGYEGINYEKDTETNIEILNLV